MGGHIIEGLKKGTCALKPRRTPRPDLGGKIEKREGAGSTCQSTDKTVNHRDSVAERSFWGGGGGGGFVEKKKNPAFKLA